MSIFCEGPRSTRKAKNMLGIRLRAKIEHKSSGVFKPSKPSSPLFLRLFFLFVSSSLSSNPPASFFLISTASLSVFLHFASFFSSSLSLSLFLSSFLTLSLLHCSVTLILSPFLFLLFLTHPFVSSFISILSERSP